VGWLASYGDKRMCNKRIGPGGGTRRLHHYLLLWLLAKEENSFQSKGYALLVWHGDEIGSTVV